MLVYVFIGITVIVPRARANGREAVAAELEHGDALYRDAKFQAALEVYSTAYLARPDPALLLRIGRCSRRLGHHEAAAFFYRGYLAGLPDAPDRAEVERLIAEAEAARVADDLRAGDARAIAALSQVPPPPVAAPARRYTWLWVTLGVVLSGGAAAGLGIGLTQHAVAVDQLGTIDVR